MSRRQTMAFRDALALVPDDMPDGAAMAMAHEIAGLDYPDGFDELACEADDEVDGYDGADVEPVLVAPPPKAHPSFCECGKRCADRNGLRQHRNAKHGGMKSGPRTPRED